MSSYEYYVCITCTDNRYSLNYYYALDASVKPRGPLASVRGSFCMLVVPYGAGLVPYATRTSK
eukprot:scaffold107688_cov14-Prasinocladus_malaysianus.AAC.1